MHSSMLYRIDNSLANNLLLCRYASYTSTVLVTMPLGTIESKLAYYKYVQYNVRTQFCSLLLSAAANDQQQWQSSSFDTQTNTKKKRKDKNSRWSTEVAGRRQTQKKTKIAYETRNQRHCQWIYWENYYEHSHSSAPEQCYREPFKYAISETAIEIISNDAQWCFIYIRIFLLYYKKNFNWKLLKKM